MYAPLVVCNIGSVDLQVFAAVGLAPPTWAYIFNPNVIVVDPNTGNKWILAPSTDGSGNVVIQVPYFARAAETNEFIRRICAAFVQTPDPSNSSYPGFDVDPEDIYFPMFGG